MIFSKEFERRSRWAGNGQDGFFGKLCGDEGARLEAHHLPHDEGYFDDNLKGGEGRENTVGGAVDPERAQPIRKEKQAVA